MQPNHMGFGITPRGDAIVATMLAKRPYQDMPSGFPHWLFLDDLAPRGHDFTLRLLGGVALTLLSVRHRQAMARHVFEPRTPARLYEDGDKLHRLINPAERDLLRPHYVAVGVNDAGRSLEFAVHDDNHQRIGSSVFASLRTLESYGPDGAAALIGTTILDMLRELHPAPFARFPTI